MRHTGRRIDMGADTGKFMRGAAGTFGVVAVVSVVVNLALLAGAVWVVVKVLQHMNVI